jgi:hypothetical protein
MWNDPPEYQDVFDQLKRRAEVTGRLRSDELELSILQARIAKIAPRNPAARIIGTDDENGAELIRLQRSILDAKRELDVIEAEIDFHNYHKEIFKSVAFKGRA